MSYPQDPGFVAGNESSKEAATSVQDSVENLRSLIRRFVASSPDGRTCDEIEIHLDLSHQTASARCAELKRMGHLSARKGEDGKKIRRKTRSGRNADVLYPTD